MATRVRKGRTRLVVGLGLVGVLALLTTGVVLAQEDQLGGKVLSGNEVTIPAGTTVDHDVYLFGGTLSVNGTVKGDVVALGGQVAINGTVNGDVLAAGGNLSVNGPVTGDVRIAGGNVAIAGDVTEDVAAAGGQVTMSGKIGQDLLVSAGNLTLSGSVAGSTTGSAGTYSKSGTVAGSDGIHVTGRAGGYVPAPSNPVLDAIRQYIAVLLVAVLALWLVPRAFAAAEERVREQPAPAFGWGIVTVIGYVVAIVAIVVLAIVLAIVFGALGFGALLGLDLLGAFAAISGFTLAFVIAAAFLADAIVGLALARLVADRSGSLAALRPAGMQGQWADLGLLAVGAAVVVIVTSLPAIGWLFKLVVIALGLGGLWLAWRPMRPAMTAPIGMPPPMAPPAPPTTTI
jgi:hypothetical protein